MTDGAQPRSDAIAELQRWVSSGGLWEIQARTPNSVVVSLCPCTGGEVVARIESDDPAFLDYLDNIGGDDPR